jgi:hypothetical protein
MLVPGRCRENVAESLAAAKAKVGKHRTELTEEQKRVGQFLKELSDKRLEAQTAQAGDTEALS